jgi:tetratricopeptide (TPR) repeat protein
LCILARDEEANIADCLQSAAGLFEEVVVLDTGSRDRTVAIAQSLGARVEPFVWCDDFAAARNAVLEHAQGPWIFWLDADDRLDEVNRGKLREVLHRLPDTNVAFSMKCRCVPDGSGAGATLVDHIRLFRKGPKIRWQYRVHEQILPALRQSGAQVQFVDVVIDHVGYVDPALRGRKLQRDLRLLEEQHRQLGDEPFTLFNLGATHLEMGQMNIALPFLEASLRASHPADSIVRKLHALIASCQARQGNNEAALQAIQRGLRDCPGDAELLLLEGILRTEVGDLSGAQSALLRLVGESPEAGHFASVAAGLRGERAYHQLGQVSVQQGNPREAEAWYRRAVECNPQWRPSWSALAQLWAQAGQWQQLDEAIAALEAIPSRPTSGLAGAQAEAWWWRARRALALGQPEEALHLLETACTHWPEDRALASLREQARLATGREKDETEGR